MMQTICSEVKWAGPAFMQTRAEPIGGLPPGQRIHYLFIVACYIYKVSVWHYLNANNETTATKSKRLHVVLNREIPKLRFIPAHILVRV